MTEQEKAIYMLKRLKAAGVSYKAFCEQTGVNVDSIYNGNRNGRIHYLFNIGTLPKTMGVYHTEDMNP